MYNVVVYLLNKFFVGADIDEAQALVFLSPHAFDDREGRSIVKPKLLCYLCKLGQGHPWHVVYKMGKIFCTDCLLRVVY